MSNIELSKVWPEWKVEDKPLGRGSYGVVYKAVRLDHDVESYAAIKVISIPQNESEVDSLRSEGLSMDATRTSEILSILGKQSMLTGTFASTTQSLLNPTAMAAAV